MPTNTLYAVEMRVIFEQQENMLWIDSNEVAAMREVSWPMSRWDEAERPATSWDTVVTLKSGFTLEIHNTRMSVVIARLGLDHDA